MSDIAAFLRARHDEAEARIREVWRAKPDTPPHQVSGRRVHGDLVELRIAGGQPVITTWAEIIERFYDPADPDERALADIEAKRRIVDRCAFAADYPAEVRVGTPAELAWAIMVDLAQPDADHPDYDPEWRL